MAENQLSNMVDPGHAGRHELPLVFAAHGLALNETLVEMLDEHFSHRTERRGCGFTQATRHLAALVNECRGGNGKVVSELFPAWSWHAGSRSAAEPWDIAIEPVRAILRQLPALLEREESRLLMSIIEDLVTPIGLGDVPVLVPWAEPIPVGTCPLAEKYFLEISDSFVRRKGRVNVLVSENDEPLLLEKLNLGDNHSCISLAQLCLNGVRLPPGCLFAVRREPGVETRPNRTLPGHVVRVGNCRGFRFLRLTTLSVSPEHRKRAFTKHFQSQVDAGLFAPGDATVEQLRRVAKGQL